MELTKNETEIMDVLWKEGRPLSRTEIVDLSPPDKTWKDSSIHILLNSLLRKEAIREAGFIRAGKGFGRTFEPSISQEDFYAEFLSDAARKVNSTTFFSALFRDESITMDTLLELERMIEKKKEELK
ncbi:BlaI/MecI/CopY family transcriptional regulator [Faecalispora anaeroviscerum]|uniref:BlaI/MecI/CopY family transcriptional regulator n=1 Tax=Faecalispora anaeroviscerum TaxID=2991836 RepID=UPI0024BA4DBA|nr:BlaI/MecI/CopY family transcriptional regulator [Faecalispora anaeroviscerum]